MCHGRHVRQYHNELQSKTQKEQEYYLGKWKIFDGLKLGKITKIIMIFRMNCCKIIYLVYCIQN